MRFDARTGRRLTGPVRVNRRGYSPLMITRDGRRMVVVGYDGVTVRDAATLAVLERLPGAGVSGSLSASPLRFQTVSAPYALSSDDRTLAVGDTDGSLRLLDLETGDVRTASGRHAAAVSDARFTPDGRSVITTGDDGDIIVWDVRGAAAGERLSGHAGFVFSPMISRDGATLYTASLDGTVFIWDLAGSRRLGRPLAVGAEGTGGAGMALSGDGAMIAVARGGGVVGLVDADSLQERRTVPVLPGDAVTRLGFVPGGHLLVVGGETGGLALLDADSGRMRKLSGHRSVHAQPGLQRRRTPARHGGGRRDRPALVAARRAAHWARRCASATACTTRSSARTAAGSRSCCSPRAECPTRWRSGTSGPGASWLACASATTATLVRFSPDGRLVAVGNNSGRAQVWSTTTWEPVSPSVGGHAGALNGAAISRDGSTLATGGDDGMVRLWDIGTGRALGAPLPGLVKQTVVPSFTADGTHLLAAYETGDAYLWDIRRESLVRQACRVAGRRLTRAEWDEFLPGRDYEPAC